MNSKLDVKNAVIKRIFNLKLNKFKNILKNTLKNPLNKKTFNNKNIKLSLKNNKLAVLPNKSKSLTFINMNKLFKIGLKSTARVISTNNLIRFKKYKLFNFFNLKFWNKWRRQSLKKKLKFIKNGVRYRRRKKHYRYKRTYDAKINKLRKIIKRKQPNRFVAVPRPYYKKLFFKKIKKIVYKLKKLQRKKSYYQKLKFLNRFHNKNKFNLIFKNLLTNLLLKKKEKK